MVKDFLPKCCPDFEAPAVQLDCLELGWTCIFCLFFFCQSSVSLWLSVDCNLLHDLNYHCVNHHFVHLSSKNDSYFSLMKQLVGLNSALYLPVDLVSSLREMRCNLRVKERSMISECWILLEILSRIMPYTIQITDGWNRLDGQNRSISKTHEVIGEG